MSILKERYYENNRWFIRMYIIHVIAPLIVGSSIYFLFRPTSLFAFRWLECLGLLPFIYASRDSLYALNIWVPTWFVFSIPNALWVYAGTSVFNLIWYRSSASYALSWAFGFLLLSLGAEAMQYIAYLPGTFCTTDMLLIILAWTLAMIISCRFSVEYTYE